MQQNRRGIIRSGLALIGTMGVVRAVQAGADAPPGYFKDQKVVYHNNGRGKDSGEYFKGLMKNLDNHVDAVGKDHIEIRVVSHGDGLVMFQSAKDQKELADKIDALRQQGVKFLICRNTLTERKIDWKTLYGVTEADIVPSGIAELARLQQQSFLYVHP